MNIRRFFFSNNLYSSTAVSDQPIKSEEGRGHKTTYPLGYQPALDGMRGVAISLVILFHGGVPLFQGGFLGVDVFFVLSGFLITGILIDGSDHQLRPFLLDFYARRSLRLLPALLSFSAAFLLFSLVASVNFQQSINDVLSSVFYVSNWTRAFQMGYPRYLGHTWSLSIEEQFYILWPIILFAVMKVASRRLLVIFAVALALIVCFWRAWLTFNGTPPVRLYNGFDTHSDGLLIGCALALLSNHMGRPSERAKIALNKFSYVAIFGLVALCSLSSWDDRGMLAFGYFFSALCAATIIADVSWSRASCLARFLGSPILTGIGRISYGLYIWHYPIYFVLEIDQGLPTAWRNAVAIPMSLFVATLSYVYVEKPFLEFKNKIRGTKAFIRVSFGSISVIMFALGTIYFLAPNFESAPSISGELKILDYGPREIEVGASFNIQVSGRSAIWVSLDKNATGGMRIKLGDEVLDTAVAGKAMSAEVAPNLLAQAARLPLSIVGTSGKTISNVVDFDVLKSTR